MDSAVAVGIGASLITVLGTLGGVQLGARGTQQAQRELLLVTQQSDERKVRVAACASYLAATRQFRIFILVEASEFKVIEDAALTDGFYVVVGHASEYQDRLQEASASLILQVGLGSPVHLAVIRVQKALWSLARARATQGPGTLPGKLNKECQLAEDQVVVAVHAGLTQLEQIEGSSS